MSFTLFKNHPFPESISWDFLDKETYLEIEEIFSNNVKFFKPFLVDEFYPEDMFQELVKICTAYDLKRVDYSNQMNKWEEAIKIPQKFTDYAIERARSLIGTQDIHEGYHMYAHHQITSDDRVPMLPLHIDWSPGAYMIDLHIGGNRDWAFVAGFEEFVCRPNQAIICQPQFDYHYRPSWGNDDPKEYYQAFFFHLVNDSHWSIPNGHSKSRELSLESKYVFGESFRDSDVFIKFQEQRRHMFDSLYTKQNEILSSIGRISPIPYEASPSEIDSNTHERKGVAPKA